MFGAVGCVGVSGPNWLVQIDDVHKLVPGMWIVHGTITSFRYKARAMFEEETTGDRATTWAAV